MKIIASAPSVEAAFVNDKPYCATVPDVVSNAVNEIATPFSVVASVRVRVKVKVSPAVPVIDVAASNPRESARSTKSNVSSVVSDPVIVLSRISVESMEPAGSATSAVPVPSVVTVTDVTSALPTVIAPAPVVS